MNMQRKIEGKKIAYRPMMEAELSTMDRDRMERRQERIERQARIMRNHLKAASRDSVDIEPTAARWYCLKVERGREFAVEKILLDADVEAFMPRERFVKVRHGIKIEGDLPFFPGYMLVHIRPSEAAFQGVKTVKHVVGIVGGVSGYHIVLDGHVDVFKRLCADDATPRVATDKTMGDGDTAEITAGPFAGFTCLVVSVKWSRQARAKVAIDLDGRVFEIDSMPLAFLKKL